MMGIPEQDASFWNSQETWLLREALNLLVNHHLSSLDLDENPEEFSSKWSEYLWRATSDVGNFGIHVEYLDVMDCQQIRLTKTGGVELPLDWNATTVDSRRFIRWALSEQIPFPDELRVLLVDQHCGMAQQNGEATYAGLYEDIISDETISQIKNLPLPKLRQQVAFLAAEKQKTDSTIIACARIGLLFYEFGLPKPSTLESFTSEYFKHPDVLPKLDKTAIKRLYKHLPDGYRRSAAGGQIAHKSTDIDSIIKAAAFAGYQCGSKDVASLANLTRALAKLKYTVPEDTVLAKILDVVAKLED